MTDKQFEKLFEEILDTKRLLILLLQSNKVKNNSIAGALGITDGRLSQIMSPSKYRKGKKKNDETEK